MSWGPSRERPPSRHLGRDAHVPVATYQGPCGITGLATVTPGVTEAANPRITNGQGHVSEVSSPGWSQQCSEAAGLGTLHPTGEKSLRPLRPHRTGALGLNVPCPCCAHSSDFLGTRPPLLDLQALSQHLGRPVLLVSGRALSSRLADFMLLDSGAPGGCCTPRAC